ncbi:MAG: hypothetical protein QG573_2721 [Acidobacteriota bacterium]|nr:hypothetical protein [Acidobacteriota bacterium]
MAGWGGVAQASLRLARNVSPTGSGGAQARQPLARKVSPTSVRFRKAFSISSFRETIAG